MHMIPLKSRFWFRQSSLNSDSHVCVGNITFTRIGSVLPAFPLHHSPDLGLGFRNSVSTPESAEVHDVEGGRWLYRDYRNFLPERAVFLLVPGLFGSGHPSRVTAFSPGHGVQSWLMADYAPLNPVRTAETPPGSSW